jgi:hypothetical protein
MFGDQSRRDVLKWAVLRGGAALARGLPPRWAGAQDVVVKIHRSLKFPSGRPVDAQAVKYLFDRGLQSPEYMRLIFPTLLAVTRPDTLCHRLRACGGLGLLGRSP